MKHFNKYLLLLLCSLLILPAQLTAQDKEWYDQSQFENKGAVIMKAAPPDTNNRIQANRIWYTNNGSDRYIWLGWEIECDCFWGCSPMSVWVYRDGGEIYTGSWNQGYLTGRIVDLTWQYTHGPATTHTYTVRRHNVGAWGCDTWWTGSVDATTVPLKAPINVTATNTDSDKNIYLSWANGSDNPISQYDILKYEGDTFLESQTVYSTTGHTYANKPHLTQDKTYRWYIRAVYGSNTATSAYKTATVFAYKFPYNVTATRDIIPGKVQLTWQCNSEYATHFRIYRYAPGDLTGTLIATVPSSQKTCDDITAEPRVTYNYRIVSYNNIDNYESQMSTPAEVLGSAAYLLASDGTEDNKVRVLWNNHNQFNPGFYDQLHLYRDDVEIVDPNIMVTGYNDLDAVPGKIHKYTLKLVKGITDVLVMNDYGFRTANGVIEGKVMTSTQVGVPHIEVRTWAQNEILSQALSLDGVDDYVAAQALKLNSNTVTISAWIKRNGTPDDNDGLIYCPSVTASGLRLMSNGELRYNWNDQINTSGWSSGLIVPDNIWTFVALVVEPTQATLYMNDTSAVNSVMHDPSPLNSDLELGRDQAAANRYFKGLIDEVCVWRTAHTAAEVMANKRRILAGDEPNLTAYWRFTITTGGVAGDYAIGGNHHGIPHGSPSWVNDIPLVWHYAVSGYPQFINGDFRIYNIYWGDGANFTIKPYKQKHGFKPDSLIQSLDENKHVWLMQDNIRFIDTTSIAVSGYIYLTSNPPCPVPNAEMLLDDNPTMTYSDSSGQFSVMVGEAGTYKLQPQYFNHTFIPADTTLEVIDAITGLIFWDTTTTTLNGKVVGVCDNFLGLADVNIKSMVSGCIDTTLKTDGQGFYQITLPAQQYIVRVVEIDHPERVTILNYLKPDTVDITQADGTADFIYHSPPIMSLSGLPNPGCGVYNVPVAYQEDGFRLKIDITEKFGELECPTDTGTVHILDQVAYKSSDTTLPLASGSTYYDVIPGYPNLSGGGVHPYQKMLVVRANVAGYTVSDTLWLLVLGQKPRSFEFSTVSPEIPLMILRDPPGDMSYSYLSQSTTSSVNIGFSFESEVGVGVFANFKVGGGADVPGLGSTGAWVGVNAEANVGVRSTLEGTQQIVISATEMLKTSDSDVIVGSAGDVYMGAAINLLYAKTDILDYDALNCTVVRDTGIVWNGNGFKTTYLYTESHIRASVIPGLQAMADILNSSGDPIKQDSAEVLLNQIQVWQQVLDYNASLKDNAVPLPGFPENISLSAGTSISEEATVGSTSTLSVGLNLFIDASVALSIGAKAGDFNEVEAGVKIFAKLDIGVSEEVSYEISNTIGFELADDDAAPPGDAFTLDILGDPVYGTPVFKLLGGKSSCPWEAGTLPREGVGLTMNTFELYNIPPEIPASFDLYLYNLTQNDETRSYLLSLVQGSNPDAAVISVGGAVLGDDELQFTMPPNRDAPQRATLRVERVAGSAFDYENLQVHLYSPCDEQIDTTVSFSVHFVKPCSDVKVVKPARNWLLNTTTDSTLVIVLKEYDPNDAEMTELKCEYRLKGAADWTTLFSYVRANLPPDSICYNWDMSAVTQGDYELRALTMCPAGIFYTGIYSGTADFTYPVAFGHPEPADGSLDAGDDIAVDFSEVIDCATATTQNISMFNTSKNLVVDIDILCKDDRLIITAKNPADMIEGDSMEVVVSSVADLHGNVIQESIVWEFIVNIVSLLPAANEPKLPTEFALDQNYPNPFNPKTTIRFAIPKTVEVELVIYDVTGRAIMKPVKERLVAGYYNLVIDGSKFSSGVYFYHLKAGNFRQTHKLILLK